MAYRTEYRSCSYCFGSGTIQSTVYVSNPSPTGPTSVPVTQSRTCSSCYGRGGISHQVFVPDHVGTSPSATARTSSRSPRKSLWSRYKEKKLHFYADRSEKFKKSLSRFVAVLIAASSASIFFFSARSDGAPLSTASIQALIAFVLLFFILSKPMRRVSLALANMVENTFEIFPRTRAVLEIAFWIAVAFFVLYLIT